MTVKFFNHRKGPQPDGAAYTIYDPAAEAGPDTHPRPLSFHSADGAFSQSFPPEVVDAVRLAISRLLAKSTLPSRLAVVSALSQEGVTYISRAFATVLANDLNVSVCAVELNWWRPDKEMASAGGYRGLAGVLAGDTALEDAVLLTDRPNLGILPAGKMDVVTRPVMARSEVLKEQLAKLNERYQYLILDIPAVLATNDAIPLATLGTACSLVINQGITSIENVRLTLDEIDQLKILGVVLNRVKLATPPALLNLIPQDPVAQTAGPSR